jgi:hypothetical protein
MTATLYVHHQLLSTPAACEAGVAACQAGGRAGAADANLMLHSDAHLINGPSRLDAQQVGPGEQIESAGWSRWKCMAAGVGASAGSRLGGPR